MVVRESSLRDLLRLFMWYPLRWLLLAIPPQYGYLLLKCMGSFHAFVSRRKRQMLHTNLRRMDLDTATIDTEHEVTRYLQVHYINQLCILLFPSITRESLNYFMEFEGLEKLESALSSSRGVVLAHAHFGPVHLPLFALGILGYPIIQLGNPSHEGLSWIGRHVAFRIRSHYEAMIPADIVPVGSDYRRLFRHLKSNKIVMIAADGSGDVHEHGPHFDFPFLGNVMRFPLGAASLATRTNAVLLPVFLSPGTNALWKCTVEAPINYDAATEGLSSKELSIQFIRRYERYAKQWPGCMHFLDRYSPGKFIISNSLSNDHCDDNNSS